MLRKPSNASPKARENHLRKAQHLSHKGVQEWVLWVLGAVHLVWMVVVFPPAGLVLVLMMPLLGDSRLARLPTQPPLDEEEEEDPTKQKTPLKSTYISHEKAALISATFEEAIKDVELSVSRAKAMRRSYDGRRSCDGNEPLPGGIKTPRNSGDFGQGVRARTSSRGDLDCDDIVGRFDRFDSPEVVQRLFSGETDPEVKLPLFPVLESIASRRHQEVEAEEETEDFEADVELEELEKVPTSNEDSECAVVSSVIQSIIDQTAQAESPASSPVVSTLDPNLDNTSVTCVQDPPSDQITSHDLSSSVSSPMSSCLTSPLASSMTSSSRVDASNLSASNLAEDSAGQNNSSMVSTSLQSIPAVESASIGANRSGPTTGYEEQSKSSGAGTPLDLARNQHQVSGELLSVKAPDGGVEKLPATGNTVENSCKIEQLASRLEAELAAWEHMMAVQMRVNAAEEEVVVAGCREREASAREAALAEARQTLPSCFPPTFLASGRHKRFNAEVLRLRARTQSDLSVVREVEVQVKDQRKAAELNLDSLKSEFEASKSHWEERRMSLDVFFSTNSMLPLDRT